MSVSDLIRERMKKKGKSDEPESEEISSPEETRDIGLTELSNRVGDSGLKRLRIEQQYVGRRTISASVPAWIKAALDYVAISAEKSGQGQYSGFGGKSRFIAEALEEKLKTDFPDVYKKLQRES
jgi:hypothetical protein